MCECVCACVVGVGGPSLSPSPVPRPRLPARHSLERPPTQPPSPPHPQEEGRAAAAGKRKVSAAQSDAKILKELFGGGYLEIRPCEGPRVQITAAPAPEQTAAPGCLDGARVAGSEAPDQPPRTPGRWVRFPPGFSSPLLSRTSSREPPHSRGRAWGVWAGLVRTESDQGTRAFDNLRALLPARRPGGRPQLPRKVLSLEAKVALLSTQGFCLLFADRHRVQRCVCAGISAGRALLDTMPKYLEKSPNDT